MKRQKKLIANKHTKNHHYHNSPGNPNKNRNEMPLHPISIFKMKMTIPRVGTIRSNWNSHTPLKAP